MRLDDGQIEVITDQMADILRGKSPAERLKIGFEMWTSAREMIQSYVSFQHPEWSEKQLKQEVARRLLHGAA